MKASLFTTSLSTGLIFAGSVWADVTPEDVWADFENMMSSMGMTLNAAPVRDGDALIARDVTYEMSFGTALADMTAVTTIPEIVFRDIGDGKVEMAYKGDFVSTTSMPAQPELEMPAYAQESTMRFDGPIIAEGAPGDIRYRFDAVAMEMRSAPVVVDGKTLQPGFSMTGGPLSGSYSSTKKGAELLTEFDVSGNALSYKIDAFEVEDGMMEMSFEAQSVAASGFMNLPQNDGAEPGNFMDVFADSTMDVTYGLGASTFAMKMQSPDTGEMEIMGTSGTSALDFKILDGQMTYGVAADDTDLSVAGMMIPGGKAALGIGRYETALEFPVVAAQTPRPMDLTFALEEVVLPDIAWMIVDPSGQLPRDPASLRLTLNGTMTSEFGIFDFDKLMELEDSAAMPFEMKTAAIPELFLSIAGATIEGNGAGSFSGGVPAVPGGMPPFAGKLSLTLTGVTGLLDKLSSTGIVPPEQAMGAQMMLGMLARPGEGADVLVSEIEMREDGSVLANGAPLPF